MKDYYLRADTPAALFATLEAAGLMQDVAGAPMPTGRAAVDVIGTIYDEPTEAEDGTITPGAAQPGYHCNLRVFQETDEIEAAIAEIVLDPPPATPYRVFWG
jgi:hypothetical protein